MGQSCTSTSACQVGGHRMTCSPWHRGRRAVLPPRGQGLPTSCQMAAGWPPPVTLLASSSSREGACWRAVTPLQTVFFRGHFQHQIWDMKRRDWRTLLFRPFFSFPTLSSRALDRSSLLSMKFSSFRWSGGKVNIIANHHEKTHTSSWWR